MIRSKFNSGHNSLLKIHLSSNSYHLASLKFFSLIISGQFLRSAHFKANIHLGSLQKDKFFNISNSILQLFFLLQLILEIFFYSFFAKPEMLSQASNKKC